MPDIIGKTLNEALQILHDADFNDIKIIKNNSKIIKKSDTELVTQVRVDGDKITLVTSEFLLNI